MMDRREFLGKAFGLTVVSAVTPAILTCACEAAAKEVPLAFTPFTIDIFDPKYELLQDIDNSVKITTPARLLIIRADEQTFSVLTSRCPHQGVIVGDYVPSIGRITCPQHGSQFDKFGKLLKGPATIGLTRYTAVFDGDHTVTISDTQMDVEFEALRSTVIKNIYPNPFADKTTIEVTLSEAVGIELAIFDIEGNKLATVFDGSLGIGDHTFTFDGSMISVGSYFCKLTSAKGSIVQQIHIVR
jgi:Rieske Fe-S protein